MLTPEIDDPNRDAELKRLGITAEPADPAALWAEYLKQSVADIVAQLKELDDEQLTALLEAEQAGKNRASLVKAINDETTTRGD